MSTQITILTLFHKNTNLKQILEKKWLYSQLKKWKLLNYGFFWVSLAYKRPSKYTSKMILSINTLSKKNIFAHKKTISWFIFLVVIFLSILVQIVYKYDIPKPQLEEIWKQKSVWYATFEDIPNRLTVAIIAIEDKRFWIHPGIDFVSLVRATYQTIFKNNLQGASTIDQQTIKLLEQAFSRSRSRKLYEMWMAINLQFHYSKKDILLTYVNSIPFSHGIKGWSSACSIYFQKPCTYLSDAELSYLFAVAQLGINPYKEKNQKIIYTKASTLCDVLSNYTNKSGSSRTTEDGCAVLHPQQTWSFSTEDMLSWSIDLSGAETNRPVILYPIEEQLDPKIQLFLDSLPTAQKQQFSLTHYDRIEKILATTQKHREVYDAQYCCVVALDSEWNLISMNTCSDRDEETKAWKVNSCTDARQVWSAIKPFLYAYAFNKNWLHETDTIIDEPISYDLGDGSIYSPKNFDLTYRGEVSLAFALGNSLNVPAIKILDSVGVENFLWFVKEQLATFASWHDDNQKDAENVGLSLALGTYEISPYAFTQLWRFFLAWKTPGQYWENAKEVVGILSNPNNRAAAFGQDSYLNLPWRAVKTGTSRKFIDARVCGANNTKWITLCLWMGNINNQAMKWPSSEIGSYIWNIIAKGF